MTRLHNAQTQLRLEGDERVFSAKHQARLPTNTTTKNHAVHRWFNFIAGFSPEFVSNCINALPTARRGVLLDPFTGCGTAQVEGIRNGMTTIGYEPHPVFVRIARAKTAHTDSLARLNRIVHTIQKGLTSPGDPAVLGEKPAAFLLKLFGKDDLAALIGARDAICVGPLRDDDLGFLVLSRLLERTSHSQTDGIYKAPTSKKRAHNPFQVLDVLARQMRDDLEEMHIARRVLPHARIYQTSCEDMREVETGTVDLIVVSAQPG